jgi:hypothetical protein
MQAGDRKNFSLYEYTGRKVCMGCRETLGKHTGHTVPAGILTTESIFAPVQQLLLSSYTTLRAIEESQNS